MERGLSLRNLGRSFTWADLRAFITHLPETSHVRRALDPAAARRAEWLRPEVQMLGVIADSYETWQLLRQGAPAESLPQVGVIRRILDADKVSEEAPPVSRQLSAAEIRAAISARDT